MEKTKAALFIISVPIEIKDTKPLKQRQKLHGHLSREKALVKFNIHS